MAPIKIMDLLSFVGKTRADVLRAFASAPRRELYKGGGELEVSLSNDPTERRFHATYSLASALTVIQQLLPASMEQPPAEWGEQYPAASAAVGVVIGGTRPRCKLYLMQGEDFSDREFSALAHRYGFCEGDKSRSILCLEWEANNPSGAVRRKSYQSFKSPDETKLFLNKVAHAALVDLWQQRDQQQQSESLLLVWDELGPRSVQVKMPAGFFPAPPRLVNACSTYVSFALKNPDDRVVYYQLKGEPLKQFES